jgi:hypothetical protein
MPANEWCLWLFRRWAWRWVGVVRGVSGMQKGQGRWGALPCGGAGGLLVMVLGGLLLLVEVGCEAVGQLAGCGVAVDGVP